MSNSKTIKVNPKFAEMIKLNAVKANKTILSFTRDIATDSELEKMKDNYFGKWKSNGKDFKQ